MAGQDANSTSVNVGMSATFTIYDEDGNLVRTGTVVTSGVGLPTTHCIWSADFQAAGVTYHVEAEGYLGSRPAAEKGERDDCHTKRRVAGCSTVWAVRSGGQATEWGMAWNLE